MTRITPATARRIAAAAEVLLDLGEINDHEADALASIARTRLYWPNEADIVARAIESWADAHGDGVP